MENDSVKKVIVTKVGEGEFLLKPVKRTLEDALGSYHLPAGKSVDDLMEEAEVETVDNILQAGN